MGDGVLPVVNYSRFIGNTQGNILPWSGLEIFRNFESETDCPGGFPNLRYEFGFKKHAGNFEAILTFLF
jgi:hypothetical protein